MANYGKYGNKVQKGIALILQSKIAVFVLIVIACSVLDNPRHQDAIWIGPYFSGASNLTLSSWDWYVDFDQIDYFDELPQGEQNRYRFRSTDSHEVIHYDFNSVGYLYVSWISRNIFFWMGDMQAVEWLQILLHALFTILVIDQLNRTVTKCFFLIGYGFNPLIIYFVTYPYGFFWTVIPSVLFILLTRPRPDQKYALGGLALLLGLSFSTRATTLFFLIFILGWLLFKKRWSWALIVTASTLLGAWLFDSFAHRKNPFFTMYVGVAAYPNPFVKEMSDNAGYEMFKEKTGIDLSFSIKGNYYSNDVQEKFREVFKDEYLRILLDSPGLLLRNALLNFLQSYSIGYFTSAKLLSYLSCIGGVLVIVWLFMRGQFVWLMAIGTHSMSFTPYYPPIQAYMFGAFILIIFAILSSFDDISHEKKSIIHLLE